MIHGQCSHHDSRQKKANKNIGGRKIHEYGKPKAPTNCFQLHLSLIYLHALRNKLNPKSVLMECMFFFSLILLYNIYLFTFVVKICLFILVPVMCNLFPKKGKCYFWNWIEENFMTTNKNSNVISNGDHIYPLDKTLSVPN